MGATPRAKRNMDSGPPTALFSFDRDRERDMAERAAATRPEWLQARYRLIDEVLAYRRTGALTPDLLAACEAERKAAPWCRSQGLHRLVQLCADGHAVAATQLDSLMMSNDWRTRFAALDACLQCCGDESSARGLVKRGLSDRSRRVRELAASQTLYRHLCVAALDLEAAATDAPGDAEAKDLFSYLYYLRRNELSGTRGVYGGTREEAGDCERLWNAFRTERRR